MVAKKYFSFFSFISELIITMLIVWSVPAKAKKMHQKPNVVFILADDLGYGDLSCYGQKHFNTPNIDKLAKNGMRFTQFYAGTTVCAPSRSSLMTGQHTGHTPIRGNKRWKPEGQWPLPCKAFTIAELLKNSGYKTGAFGKWGLGYIDTEGSPNKQGFDEFFGYNCQSLAHNYYPYYLWHNSDKVILEQNSGNQANQYAPEIIHNQALNFIESNKDIPFFLFYSTVLPHAELSVPENYLAKYREKFLPEKIFRGVDGGENYRRGPYGSQAEPRAAFAAMVDYLDNQVGELVNKLKELGIYDNTLIIFTSDNGPHLEGGADPDYFDSNGPLRGYKRDLYEGGIRVPMVISWKGIIRSESISNHISAFWDFFPTICELTGNTIPEAIDGISFLPTLLGQDVQEKHDYLYWEFHELGGRQAVRKGNWKYVSYNVFDPEKRTVELYNLSTDIGEDKNIGNLHPDIIKEMNDLLNRARTPSDVFPFK
jgi:arylsulfatase A